MRRKSKTATNMMAEEVISNKRDYDEENPKISSPSEIINGITFGEITVPKNHDGMIDGDDGDASSNRSAGWGDCDQSTSNGTTDTGYTGANSTKNGSHPIPADSQSAESFNIAKKENRYVNNMRLIMFGVLIITTVMVAFGVYTFVANTERRDFESSYEDNSLKIYESLGSSMDTKLEAVDSLAMLMVSNAKEKNETWPFTTLPDFASKAAKMRILSNAIALQQYQWIEEEQRTEWEQYAKANEQWVQEVIDVERMDTTFNGPSPIDDYDFNNNFSTSIRYSGDYGVEGNTGPYTPTWQTYPALPSGNYSVYNFNAIQHKKLGPGIRKVVEDHRVVIGPVLNFEDSKEASGVNRVTAWAQRHVSEDVDASEPIIRMLYPILNTTYGAITVDEPNSNVVGILASSFFWKSFLINILPFGEKGLMVVFSNTCNQSFTYQINGHEAEYFGTGDQHDPQFDDMGYSKTFEEIGLYSSSMGNYGGLPIDEEFCAYTVSTYPSQLMKDSHHTSNPVIFTIVTVSIFIFTAILFMVFDALVQIRQQKVMTTAVKTTAIVSSLFPSNVRDRLLDENPNAAGNAKKENDGVASMFQPTKTRLRTFLNDGEPASEANKPIADLFTDTTVLFADIAGFTAWSSVREPTQVFTLLETVYGAFDNIAQRRGVFKVETIGDSYVAVTGLPDPRADHAVVMAKFAKDCRQQFNELCSILEEKLGPETGDLRLRLGLHSGPVTAGVLRGQKSRFQLFGDTVNTAARMESTGKPNKIQVSQATADLLKESKKLHWLQPREEMVEAKGKGLMMTYWVEPRQIATSVATATTNLTTSTIRSGSIASSYVTTTPTAPASSDGTSSSIARPTNSSSSTLSSTIHRGSPSTRVVSSTQLDRLIKWNVDVMERLLKKVVSRRAALTEGGIRKRGVDANWNRPHETMVLNEVKEVIKLPEYNSKYTDVQENPDSIILETRVRSQLREFVTAVAETYDSDNPFHNFPHASHVAMSVAKLLSRIVAPDEDFTKHEQLHDHTYGITSDPLTQFACLFSALIHDANHPGVPNVQLVKEGTDLAQLYEGKCIAEQNSINIAWKILIEKKYTDLRNAICATRQEETRFRQLVVNAVCATDIMDKDLKRARNERWAKAFSTASSIETHSTRSKSIISSASSSSSTSGTSYLQEQINRKATIVIEHIIQASDVAHTMQHWHIYIKWNERLYAEMYKAYVDGRSDSDPTDSWYKGEIGFFDFYIIPLAQKLSECGVFGVSSDEYLNYATMNRNEWEKKGKDVVAGYVKKYHTNNRSNHSIFDEDMEATKTTTKGRDDSL